MKGEIRTALIFGAVIATAIGALSIGLTALDEQALPPVPVSDNGDAPVAVQTIDKSRFKQAPEIQGIFEYINTSEEGLAEAMEDKVVLYDIWTYSCINCIRTLPYITAWDDKYADEGLLIIGIHSPEFEFEKDPGNVRMAVEKYGIKYPVVMDNEMDTWKAFENRYWPRKYIADHEGFIRYDHIGEGGYDESERVIQKLLEERAASLGMQTASAEELVDLEEFEHTRFDRTPELYLGYHFASGRNQLGSPEGFQPEQTVSYVGPPREDLHKFYLTGEWKNHADSMELVSETGTITLLYNAKEVNIVTENAGELEILIDGAPPPPGIAGIDVGPGGIVSVDAPDLYNLVSEDSTERRLIEITATGPGFQLFTFTFG